MTAGPESWRPRASLGILQRRAGALETARDFFAARAVLEIETPLLVAHPVSDPQIANLRCQLAVRPGVPYYLHTSPEYHMKRLLAAGAPDIYQICKVFRDGESGPRHLPEFTIVEWYRRGADYGAFIREACDFVRVIADYCGRALGPPDLRNYSEVFLAAAGFDPLEEPLAEIRRRASALVPGGVPAQLSSGLGDNRAGWLDLLMVTVVEPWLQGRGLLVLDRYPAEQAALARLDAADPRVAERFEIYLDGIEVANGFHELADAGEQRRRFEADRVQRLDAGLADAPVDNAFLAALESGLPDCCGVALGFDRLLMACLGLRTIDEVVSFVVPESG